VTPPVKNLLRIAPLALAVSAALSLGGPARAQIPGAPELAIGLSFSSHPTFSVEHLAATTGSGFSVGEITAGEGGKGPPPPAAVAIDVPAQYAIDVAATPGSVAGFGFMSSFASSSRAASSVSVFGELIVADPASYASDPTAQACVPGPYLAVWRLDTTVLGFSLSVPVFVVRSAGSATGIELHFCAPTPTTADGKPAAAPIDLTSLELFLTQITPPTSAGTFLWHSFVTPKTPGTNAPNSAATYELRALVPVPHKLAVKGSFEAKLRAAVLTGSLTEAGKAQAHADVFVATSGSDAFPIHARTDAHGRFTLKERISRTTTFLLDVPDQTVGCTGATTAPGGCLSTTISAPGGKRVRVVVPPAHG